MPRALCRLLMVSMLLPVLAGGLLRAAAGRVLVAVVRDDGKILPFGVLDGERWKPAWTPPAKVAEVPIRLTDVPADWLRDVPFATRWRLFPDEGDPRDVQITGTTWVPALCRQQVLFESSEAARDPMRPPDGPFVPKHGLATLGGGRVERPVVHDAASPLRAEVTDALVRYVDRAEEWTLRGAYAGVFVHPYELRERRTYPLHVVTLATGPGPDGLVAYFEAIRRYPREAHDPDNAWCDIVTYAAGWTHGDGRGGAEATIVDLEITSCMLERAIRRTPLGIVYAGDVATWVMEERRTEERIAVYRPPGREPGALLLEATTGTCSGR